MSKSINDRKGKGKGKGKEDNKTWEANRKISPISRTGIWISMPDNAG
jgi:hypothetical protein